MDKHEENARLNYSSPSVEHLGLLEESTAETPYDLHSAFSVTGGLFEYRLGTEGPKPKTSAYPVKSNTLFA